MWMCFTKDRIDTNICLYGIIDDQSNRYRASPEFLRLLTFEINRKNYSLSTCWFWNSLQLNFLLYANPLLSMSGTANCLQKCNDRLYNYGDKWRLQISIKKTTSKEFKIHKGHLYKNVSNVNKIPVKRAKNYTYVDIHENASGSFTESRED